MGNPIGNMPTFPTLSDSAVAYTPEEAKKLSRGEFAYDLGNQRPNWEKSYAYQAIQQSHQSRLDQAKRHHDNIQNYYYTLDDPNSTLTPEERQQYQNQYEGAWDDLLKIPGLDKDVKNELLQRRENMKQVLTHGRSKVADTMISLQPPQADQRATTQTTPSPTDVPAGAATSPTPASMAPPADYEAQSWGQSASMAPPPGMTPPNSDATPASMTPPASAGAGASPPPAPSSASGTGNMPPLPHVLPGEMLGPSVQAGMATDIATSNRIRERAAILKAGGVAPGSEEYKYGMVNNTGNLPTMGTAKVFIRPDGSSFNGRQIGMTVYNEYGEAESGSKPATAAQQAAPTLVQQNGVPIGVKRAGDTRTPDSPDWNKEDERIFTAGMKAHTQNLEEVAKRQKEVSDRYSAMRGKVMQYFAWDKATGTSHYVNSNTINEDPNRYMAASGPAGGTQQANRSVALQEIQNSTNVLGKAVDGLNDSSDWDLGTLTTLQQALRDPDDTLVGSKVLNAIAVGQAAGKLTPEQAEYAMAILNARESVMRIGVVAALGQGATDQMRSAVVGMLPSGTTPNKTWAKRQLALTNQQFDIFAQAIPSAESLGLHGPGAGGAGGGAATPQKRAAPKVGEIVNGHRYKGGPFNSPSSWEAVAPATPGAK